MALNRYGSAESRNETAPGNSGLALNRFAEKNNWVAASNRDFRTTDCCCSSAPAAKMSYCLRETAHRRLPRAADRSWCAPIPAPEHLTDGSNCRSLAARGRDRSSSLALPKSACCFPAAAKRHCSPCCLPCDSNSASLKADGFARVRAAAGSSRSWPANSLFVRLLLRCPLRRSR